MSLRWNDDMRKRMSVGMKVWRAWGVAGVFCLGAAMWGGCGDAEDKPEDCLVGEYFHESQKLCVACAAPVEPKCEPGCGFRIVADDNGCPVSECSAQCQCEAGEYFSSATFSCEPCAQAQNPPAMCAQ